MKAEGIPRISVTSWKISQCSPSRLMRDRTARKKLTKASQPSEVVMIDTHKP